MIHLGIAAIIAKFKDNSILIIFRVHKRFFGLSSSFPLLSLVGKSAYLGELRRLGMRIGENPDIDPSVTFYNCKDLMNMQIGDHCHVGKDCFFDLRDEIIIGNNCTVSMQSTFITHLDVGKSSLKSIYPSSSAPISLGNDAYLGARSLILPGVRVGNSSLITAGSVITKTVPDNSVVGGVPGKVIKSIPTDKTDLDRSS